MTALSISPSTTPAPASTIGDYITLLKPRVMTLVVFCGMIGMLVAPGSIHPVLEVVAVLCIALATGASGAINMWYDRDMDAVMKRTCNRPIPAGRVMPEDALAMGVVIAGGSVMLMGLAANWYAAALLTMAIAVYVGVYTVWLKRRSPQNIVIGGLAGALPPVIGWAAVTGSATLEPWLYVAIIFFWTPVHFWALCLYGGQDYAKANVPMMPLVVGHASTKRMMLVYAALVTLSCAALVVFGFRGVFFGVVAGALNILLLLRIWRLESLSGEAEAIAAKRLFFFSMLYLFIVFLTIAVDHYLPI